MEIRNILVKIIPDPVYISLIYFKHFRKFPNLKNPKTFNEKLQWLKMHDRKPEYTTMVDKYLVKDFVASKIGEQYIIPTLGVWDSPKDIDFDSLPNQFVLKWNHDSGSVIICKDKVLLNKEEVIKKLAAREKYNGYNYGREWPYKNVKPKIIAEAYMVDPSGMELRDYKFMCFSGKVRCSFVCSDRYSKDGLQVTFFDREWNKLPFERSHPSRKEGFFRPETYEKMIELAEQLSEEIPFVRVDFYEINGQTYFGELTFYPGSGLEPFDPEEWDRKLGDWIKLPVE